MIFDVLSRSLDINTDFLIEASAGTGKTYTIEHLFVRRLIEKTNEGIFLEPAHIAVLTFTKACSKELAHRIRHALDRAISELSSKSNFCPDYILQLYEGPKETLSFIRSRLIAARTSFESAFIGTIHGFCHKVISEFEGRDCDDKELISRQALFFLADEFFRKKLPSDPLEIVRIARLFSFYKNNFLQLKEHLIQTLWDPLLPIDASNHVLVKLQEHVATYTYSPASFEALAECFTGCLTREKKLKAELQKAIFALHAFCMAPHEAQKQCDLIEWPLFASTWFVKPKKNMQHAHFTDALAFLHAIEPYLQTLASPARIEESYRSSLVSYVRAHMQKEGLFSYQELLYTMQRLIANSDFCRFLQNRYKALIVDEFQDTDPVQWNILQELFLHRKEGTLHLVGDPKQAIYAFRNADVYSYMQAKDALCKSPYVLCTNYRSSPKLVYALNVLFSGSHAEKLFYLPKTQHSIQPPPISVGGQISELEVNDGKAPITFFQARGMLLNKRKWPTGEVEEAFFHFIAQEISFFQTRNIQNASCAILVKDRHQQTRLEEYLQKAGIATISRSKQELTAQEACEFLKRLLFAIMHPREKNALAAFVVHPPLSYTQKQLQMLFAETQEGYFFRAKHVAHLLQLRAIFERKGFSIFFQTLLDTCWPESLQTKSCMTMHEAILSQYNGKVFMRDLEHLVECLVSMHDRFHCSEKVLYETLLDKDLMKGFAPNALFCRYETLGDAVHIHTLHAAKGLEFDIVFALGLVTENAHTASEEEKQELLRLFYVAATRAKKRLYIPLAYAEDKPMYKNDSAVSLFLQTIEPEGLVSLIEKSKDTLCLYEVQANTHSIPSQNRCVLYRPTEQAHFKTCYEPIHVSSFSSLYKHEVEKNEKESPVGLPKGPLVGRLLHQVVETCIRFLIGSKIFFSEQACFDLVARTLIGSPFVSYTKMVFECVWNAFHAKLTGEFSLSKLSWKRAFVEAPFFLYQGKHSWLRGVVDLVFYHDDLLYLLDWKTNWLGDAAQDYTQDAMRQELVKHRYDMQVKLYQDALKKHIGKHVAYGGFFVVFLRAFCEREQPNGFLHIHALDNKPKIN